MMQGHVENVKTGLQGKGESKFYFYTDTDTYHGPSALVTSSDALVE